MTPEEFSSISSMFENLNEKLDRYANDLRKNTSATELIQHSVDALNHDLLGNGQPGKIKEMQDKIDDHQKYIYMAGGGLLVLSTAVGWLMEVIHNLKR